MNDITLFLLFTGFSLFLFVLEVFLPGGVVGLLGLICLGVACMYSFAAFGTGGGTMVSILLIGISIGGMLVWLLILPRTKIGKRIAHTSDLTDAKSMEEDTSLVGRSGVADTDLRPSGFALIDGKRIDVVTQRSFIAKGQAVEVVEVHGMRVVVCEKEESAGADAES